MDQITDQDQPVSHPVLLACASRIRAGPRAAAGQAARAGAGLATHHVSGPLSSRGPLGPPGRPGVPGIVHRRGRGCSPCISQGFPMPRPWPC
jgi:hypothetical protein